MKLYNQVVDQLTITELARDSNIHIQANDLGSYEVSEVLMKVYVMLERVVF